MLPALYKVEDIRSQGFLAKSQPGIIAKAGSVLCLLHSVPPGRLESLDLHEAGA